MKRATRCPIDFRLVFHDSLIVAEEVADNLTAVVRGHKERRMTVRHL